MEKHSAKSGSFIGRHRWRANLESHRASFSSRIQQKSPVVPESEEDDDDDVNESIPPDVDHDQILAEIDAFIDELANVDDKGSSGSSPELPDVIDTFAIIIKSKTKKSLARNADHGMVNEDMFLHACIKRLCKLKNALADFNADMINKLMQRAMVFIEEELRALLLENSKARDRPEPKLKAMSSKHFSFKQQDRSPAVPEPSPDDDYPGFSEEKISRISIIVKTMISSGYKNECSNVYSMARGNALYEQLKRLDFEKLNAEDVQKLNWDWLESDVCKWIRIIKHCSQFLIPAELKLGETIFSENRAVFRSLFKNLVRSLITSLLDYAAAIAMTKRSAERLFKFLDMYEALHGLSESMRDSDNLDYSGETIEEHSSNDLSTEISSVTDRIGEGAVNIFGDLEHSIRNDVAKTPVPGGAVHPLTRYVLNYVKYACEYGDTLEQIFQQNAKLNQTPSPEEIDLEKSPLAAQIMSVMSVLDGNLSVKSTLYKDPSLRYVFLMNNGRYILQKVKGSAEIKKLMGDNWCRRRSSEVRQYHKNYQRETWARLLQCITQEGIQVNGKVNKQVLKERFKNFNAMFDEIHKTQSSWVVSDEQLLSELRASVSAIVIPAYRSFVGRYKHHFEGGKSMDKYIKYQAEDIEAFIETLFEGNPAASMSRKRF
nr:exocyst complex component EXO70B1-like [Tanacetum cinerariifolium]